MKNKRKIMLARIYLYIAIVLFLLMDLYIYFEAYWAILVSFLNLQWACVFDSFARGECDPDLPNGQNDNR